MSTHSTPSGVLLDLRLAAGRIEIATGDRDSTTVTLEALDGGDATAELVSATREVAVQESDGTTRVIVHVPEKSGIRRLFGSPDILMRVEAPSGARVQATTASADVRCTGSLGTVSVKSASGDIELPDVDASIDVRTHSGDVRCGRVAGDSRASSMSGDVTIGDIEGSVAAKSMSGDVKLGNVTGSLEASTMSGDVTVASVRAGSVELSSMSGDIDVAVQRGTRVYLDVQTLSGEARSDLAVSDQPSDEGEAELTLTASSKSGDVRIRRAPERAAVS
ncbi:MAG: DUF4097 family beta strand repeat-containing protein [Gaiellales bacterium]